MSNYTITAKNRATGGIHRVDCFDDYFGRHLYGYQVEGLDGILNEGDFDRHYQILRVKMPEIDEWHHKENSVSDKLTEPQENYYDCNLTRRDPAHPLEISSNEHGPLITITKDNELILGDGITPKDVAKNLAEEFSALFHEQRRLLTLAAGALKHIRDGIDMDFRLGGEWIDNPSNATKVYWEVSNTALEEMEKSMEAAA